MGINFRKKVLISESIFKNCEKCERLFPEEDAFCTHCGNKLKAVKTRTYANFGKNGFTSYTIKLANGITFNSKGSFTMPLANGLSYTQKT